MAIKSTFFVTTALVCFCGLAVPAQAGQLFPPENIGPNPNVSCPNGRVLTWHVDHIDCADPTPGVSVSCPAGQVVADISNGAPVCIPLLSPSQSAWFNSDQEEVIPSASGAGCVSSRDDARCPGGWVQIGIDLCSDGHAPGYLYTVAVLCQKVGQ